VPTTEVVNRPSLSSPPGILRGSHVECGNSSDNWGQ